MIIIHSRNEHLKSEYVNLFCDTFVYQTSFKASLSEYLKYHLTAFYMSPRGFFPAALKLMLC